MILYRIGVIKIYTNVDGKLVESKVITIAPKGVLDLKENIAEKSISGTLVAERKAFELRNLVIGLIEQVKDGVYVRDEDILLYAKKIEIDLKHENNILSDIVKMIFDLGDGSCNNKIVALEQINSVLDITVIEILKNRSKKNCGV